jgi:hypothetical protein
VAGYMTVGDYETIRLIEHLVRTTFGVELTEEGYNRNLQNFLKPDEDADNDGFLNQEEWKLASPDGSLSNLDAYGTSALDGHEPIAPQTGVSREEALRARLRARAEAANR